jgi:error-prone DNA polymerase
MADYVELHAHSYFSLLDGASSPEALVQKAAEFGMPTLALTDHDAVYGAVRFQSAARQYSVKPIFGAELTLDDGHHLTLLVESESGWRNLCILIMAARHHAPKGEAFLPGNLLEAHTDGLIALSGCRQGGIPAALQRGDLIHARDTARHYQQLFGSRFYIELQHHYLPGDGRRIAMLTRLADELGIPCVATNNIHYAEHAGHRLQDVLVAIRHNCTLEEARVQRRPNSEYFLKSADQIQPLFPTRPDALRNTLQIAERCDFRLNFGLQTLPTFPTPHGVSAQAYLEQLCQEGLQRRRMVSSEEVFKQLHHELAIIDRSGLANYFLIVWDIVRFANAVSILCQGRGSAANSLVAYLLDISPINPLNHNLVFERFLADERRVTPDIDIDFDAARREEVIQYIYQRYGHSHAAMACTFVTFRARSALRDVGKALGLPVALLERLADLGLDDTPHTMLSENIDRATWHHLLDLCRQIDDYPRHLGIHSGGMIVMGVPLAERLPTEPATMEDRYVVQWDKDSLEEAGLVKIDILGLRMLSAVAEAEALIRNTQQVDPSPALDFDDQNVFQMIRDADTVGVFQVESRAQSQVLPRLLPHSFEDLMVSISLIRPGPIQGNMVHPYLRRRMGQEPVTFPHPLLASTLEETKGVVLYQEQVLQVAQHLAGFTPGQGELLRRALGKKNATEKVSEFRETFLEGAKDKGVSHDVASAVFETLRAFGSYSFPKSHAASFAVLVYRSAWLKHYHPAAFYVALLNNQPMGFWSPAVIVRDAKRHGIDILPVDVNRSGAKCTLENGAIRLGYNYVKGFGEAVIAQVMNARQLGEFTTFRDFCYRTQLPRRLVRHLILAGGMDGWGKLRRTLLWELSKLDIRPDTLALELEEDALNLAEASPLHIMSIEMQMLGVSIREHPLTFYRSQFQERVILSSQEIEKCKDGDRVTVAGMLLIHQSPPTAKGFHFLTLDDEFGFFNIILRPQLYPQYRLILQHASLLFVEGRVQQEDGVTNIIASNIIRS